VEKFGGKEVGRRGQGGWIKGDPCRSGWQPLVGGRRQHLDQRSLTVGRPLAACVDRAQLKKKLKWPGLLWGVGALHPIF
jgi:hypothetical protein